jgi:hypothetical protein
MRCHFFSTRLTTPKVAIGRLAPSPAAAECSEGQGGTRVYPLWTLCWQNRGDRLERYSDGECHTVTLDENVAISLALLPWLHTSQRVHIQILKLSTRNNKNPQISQSPFADPQFRSERSSPDPKSPDSHILSNSNSTSAHSLVLVALST